MAAYVIDASAAIRLAEAGWSGGHDLLAPTLLRAQTLSALHADTVTGRRPDEEARALLAAVDAFGVRLLGDRVLRRTAWKVASELGWAQTEAAEYVALTRLHADTLVSDAPAQYPGADRLVRIAPVSELLDGPRG
ncbi:hypothetical protein [Leifsonia virtsii]|uniref:PIN domain-containing protein n=1 Tax=Leifsonia virtsii TaxID=3035915 RepID=A0ABT8IUJ9_9MICO|nr:hypothetical protein [Leifsonia virtsii]MDN4596470.1 hypothetical protein [Leifsonia virtsii]